MICIAWVLKFSATAGTAEFLQRVNIPVQSVREAPEGSPHTVDLIRSGAIQLILNTPLGANAHSDGAEIRAAAVTMNIPLLTTLSAAAAAVAAIQAIRKNELQYRSLQEHFSNGKAE